jgi:hypothetical protein
VINQLAINRLVMNQLAIIFGETQLAENNEQQVSARVDF